MTYEERLQGEYGRLLREASAHFAGKSGVYQTLLSLARRLDEEGFLTRSSGAWRSDGMAWRG